MPTPPSAQADTDADLIRRCLERGIPRVHRTKVPIVAIRRTKFVASTSYACDILTVLLATGRRLRVFRKDFGSSQLPKDEIAQRRKRELRVYRDLLSRADLGTAKYYGSVWDESQGRFWLLLEFVDGRPLRDCTIEYWPAAAAWLGQMHAHYSQRTDLLATSGFLLRHDADYFESKVDLALRAVSHTTPHLKGRLGHIVRHYDRLVAVMASQPTTLVHGSYRPQNIMLSEDPALPRVCPVDWELAALGSSLLDLAFVSDGFKPPTLDLFFDAYREHVLAAGLPLPSREEMVHVVNCFRLHKIIKSLGDSLALRFPASVVAKLVYMGEEIRRVVV